MPSITSANAVYTITIPKVFDQGQTLSGYAADDIFTTDPVATAEFMMGMDGILSAGYVWNPVVQHITIMANSPSMYIFDQWNVFERSRPLGGDAVPDKYPASAIVTLPSLAQPYTGSPQSLTNLNISLQKQPIAAQWILINGYLTTYPPIPDAGRVLRPRRFSITWERVTLQPVSNANVLAASLATT